MLIVPRPQFLPFHNRSERKAFILAHRRAGKTVACVCELLTRAIATKKEYARYAYIAPYYGQAKEAAWQYLKLYGESLIKKVSESELSVELFNGSKIRLYGADNPDALRGGYLDGVILDEYADMRPSVWEAVVRPMLSDRKGWVVFIGTPKGHNAFYKMYQKSISESGWFSMILRASNSNIISQEELDSCRADMTPNYYEQEYECSFDAAITGAVYGEWMGIAANEGRISCKEIYDPGLSVNTAWDLGYTDKTAIWFWQVVMNEIRIIDYYENCLKDLPHYAGILKTKGYKYGTHYVPHDGVNRSLAAGERSILAQLNEYGFLVRRMPSTSQQNQIESTRLTLKHCWFHEQKCAQGIESLRQYQFELDEKKNMYKDTPRHDWASHGCDAFEIIAQVWQPQKLAKEKAKPKFFHEASLNDLWAAEEKYKKNYY